MAALQTIRDVVISCGVPNDAVLFNGVDKPDRIAEELFDNDFDSCIILTPEDIEESCKTLAGLTVNQGQIRLTPATKRNLKAFVEWAKGKMIVGEDPEEDIFPAANAMTYIRRQKAHKKYVEKSSTISDAAKPVTLTEDMKWIDWYPNFMNFLRAIPGINGIPLSYVVREEEASALFDDPNLDFLENYVRRANLNGESYDTDNLEVHTYIIHFIAGNSVAEAKITAHGQINDGRADYIALRDHFEGVGINAHEITRAQNTLSNLYYSGEKKPHMWWAEFEKELARAFAIYDRVEGRVVHSDDMKLRILLSKINADFLKQTHAALNVEIAKVPMTITYAEAISTFRNAVAQKYPPEIGVVGNRTRRTINELTIGGRGRGRTGRGGRFNRGGGRGRGRARGNGVHPYGGGRGRGRGRNGGRGNGNSNDSARTRTRPDSWWAIGAAGQVIECHPLISYPNNVWYDIPIHDRTRIVELRRQSRASSNSSVVSEVTQGTTFINGQQYALVPTSAASIQHQSQVSQVRTNLPPPPPETVPPAPPTTQVTIMGGRNEQASLRSRNGSVNWR